MSERLREFWLCDNTDNSGWSVDTEYSHKNHFGSVNVFHVIEKSAYDALAERLAECEAALGVYKAEEFRDAHFGQALSVLMAEEIFDYGKTAREYFEKWGESEL